MADTLQTTISNSFSGMKMFPKRYVGIGSDDGLAPIRRRTIT